MTNQKIIDAINEQINKELYSGYMYLAMAAWFDANDLPGFAAWMRMQAHEESMHALRFYNYVIERRGEVKLTAIDGPPTEYESATAIFEAGFKHETTVSESIDNLVTLAESEKDNATLSMLRWFVDEQVEEESSFDEVLRQLKMADGKPPMMMMLDREMAKRGDITVPAEGGGGQ